MKLNTTVAENACMNIMDADSRSPMLAFVPFPDVKTSLVMIVFQFEKFGNGWKIVSDLEYANSALVPPQYGLLRRHLFQNPLQSSSGSLPTLTAISSSGSQTGAVCV
jgi:hypothetical protein